MNTWFTNPNLAPGIQAIFKNFLQTASLKGELISTSSTNRVIKYQTNGQIYYIKHYFSPGKSIRRFIGRLRWRTEYKNLLFLKKLGIPTPEIAAYGEYKRWFQTRSQQGILITKEVPNAFNLKYIAEHTHLVLKKQGWRKKIIDQLAQYVSLLHQKKFIHYDLQWRNILVTPASDPEVYLFDIPSGHKRFIFRKKGLIRDFYNLYKSAFFYLSRSDQLRFYLSYKKKKSLTPGDKLEIKKIISYFLRKEFSE